MNSPMTAQLLASKIKRKIIQDQTRKEKLGEGMIKVDVTEGPPQTWGRCVMREVVEDDQAENLCCHFV
jgi:hypothetical protein